MIELSYHTKDIERIAHYGHSELYHRASQRATLLAEERHEIEVRLKDGWSVYRIAKKLGRSYNTIKGEIARGTVSLYNDKVFRYNAKAAEERYKENRQNSRRQYKRLEVSCFIRYVEEHFAEGWSLDACAGKALESGQFRREQVVCTKTLYNYVGKGLVGIKNIDLPEKLRRNTKREKVRKNKRILGNSIELRPENVGSREEFGHWEFDTVVGSRAYSKSLGVLKFGAKAPNFGQFPCRTQPAILPPSGQDWKLSR